MKNSLILNLLCICFMLALASCGAKYTPMSQDEIEAKIDSIYTAGMADHLTQLKDECDKSLEANIAAKVEELSNQ